MSPPTTTSSVRERKDCSIYLSVSDIVSAMRTEEGKGRERRIENREWTRPLYVSDKDYCQLYFSPPLDAHRNEGICIADAPVVPECLDFSAFVTSGAINILTVDDLYVVVYRTTANKLHSITTNARCCPACFYLM